MDDEKHDGRIDHGALVNLTLCNFIGNVLFFTIFLLIVLLPNFANSNTKWFVGLLVVVGMAYYVVGLFLAAHYVVILRKYTKDNKDVVFFIIWSSAFVLGYLATFRFVSSSVANEIFGGALVLLILDKAKASFQHWRSRTKAPMQDKSPDSPPESN